MDIRRYVLLGKVLELGSLTKAAEAMGCTQSAVSHAIAAMEKEWGLPLLVRSRSGVRLTDSGERLWPMLRAIVERQTELEETVSSIRGLEVGTVRVAAFTSVAVNWLPDILRTFQLAYPGVTFQLKNGDYSDIHRWMAEGEADVGFVALPAVLPCRLLPLREDRLLAVLPQSHPLADRDRFPLARIPQEPFISLLEESNQDACRACEAAGVTPNIRFATKDDYAILAMVEEGLGMSIMPELLLTGRTEHVRVMELDPPCSRSIALAVRQDPDPAAERFADHILEWVKKNAAA